MMAFIGVRISWLMLARKLLLAVLALSAWAAILFAPTLVGTVYGMNFDSMPELHWDWGYPLALIAMFGVSVVLFGIFRNRRWI